VDTGLRTLEDPRDEAAVRRARNYRRVGLGLILLAVVAGLTGLLGIRSATGTARGGGSVLSVEHAQVTRAGIAVPLHVRVVHPGGFDGPVRLAVSADLMERFDFQNFYPNPSKETSDGRFLTYEFDPPSGDVFEMSLDARTAPDQNGSWGTYEVRLLGADDLVTATVGFRMVVVP
jgi:hypothetical protein